MRKSERFKIVGTKYRIKNIKKIVVENDDFNLSRDDLFYSFPEDSEISQYELISDNIELIPEPENIHDSNAVKVEIDGVHVGYVKKGSCTHVKNLLASPTLKEVKLDKFLYGKVKKIYSDDNGKLHISRKEFQYPLIDVVIVTDDGNNATQTESQNISVSLGIQEESKKKFKIPKAIFIVLIALYAFMFFFSPVSSIIGILFILLIMHIHYKK